MAKFTDKQILDLLKLKIDEFYLLLKSDSSTHDERLFNAGRRSVLDSLKFSLEFYSNYDFD